LARLWARRMSALVRSFSFIVFFPSCRPHLLTRAEIRHQHVAPWNHFVVQSIRTPTKGALAMARGSRVAAVRIHKTVLIRVATICRRANHNNQRHTLSRLASPPLQQRHLCPTRPSSTPRGWARPAQTSPARPRALAQTPAMHLYQFQSVHRLAPHSNCPVRPVHLSSSRLVHVALGHPCRLTSLPTSPMSTYRHLPHASRPRNDRCYRNSYPSRWNHCRSTYTGRRLCAVLD